MEGLDAPVPTKLQAARTRARLIEGYERNVTEPLINRTLKTATSGVPGREAFSCTAAVRFRLRQGFGGHAGPASRSLGERELEGLFEHPVVFPLTALPRRIRCTWQKNGGTGLEQGHSLGQSSPLTDVEGRTRRRGIYDASFQIETAGF